MKGPSEETMIYKEVNTKKRRCVQRQGAKGQAQIKVKRRIKWDSRVDTKKIKLRMLVRNGSLIERKWFNDNKKE